MHSGWILLGVTIAAGAGALALQSSPAAPPAPKMALAAVDDDPAFDPSAAAGPVDVNAAMPRDSIHAGVALGSPAEGDETFGAEHGSAGTAQAAHGAAERAVTPGTIALASGDGAATIASLYAQSAAFAGKRVRIAAQVVKWTPDVLGHNWLHVQDGSGAPESGDFDLVVTTDGTAKVGDRIVLEGVVVRDKDIGAGYRYAVLVEDAKLEPAAGAQP